MKKKIYVKENRYYRKITESLPQWFKNPANNVYIATKGLVEDKGFYEHFVRYFMVFLVLTFIVLDVYVAYEYSNYKAVKQERLKLADNFEYWQDVSRAHPNFPDAYYNASLYAIQLGDKNRAVELLDRAIELDPSFSKAIELEKKVVR